MTARGVGLLKDGRGKIISIKTAEANAGSAGEKLLAGAAAAVCRATEPNNGPLKSAV